MFEAWLDSISSWADHDALVHNLIAPMVAANPTRVKDVVRWAKSPYRWHRRARAKMFFSEIVKLSDSLLGVRMTWCGKDWAGRCGKLRSSIQSARCHI
jgi:DNA alkylation repair enzyme